MTADEFVKQISSHQEKSIAYAKRVSLTLPKECFILVDDEVLQKNDTLVKSNNSDRFDRSQKDQDVTNIICTKSLAGKMPLTNLLVVDFMEMVRASPICKVLVVTDTDFNLAGKLSKEILLPANCERILFPHLIRNGNPALMSHFQLIMVELDLITKKNYVFGFCSLNWDHFSEYIKIIEGAAEITKLQISEFEPLQAINVPHQSGLDCGVHLVLNTMLIVADRAPTFKTEYADEARKFMLDTINRQICPLNNQWFRTQSSHHEPLSRFLNNCRPAAHAPANSSETITDMDCVSFSSVASVSYISAVKPVENDLDSPTATQHFDEEFGIDSKYFSHSSIRYTEEDSLDLLTDGSII